MKRVSILTLCLLASCAGEQTPPPRKPTAAERLIHDVRLQQQAARDREAAFDQVVGEAR